MAEITNDDIIHAQRFGESNILIRQLHIAHQKAPWIISHLDVNVRDATPNDYFIPPSLKHAAKVVEVKMTKNLCELLSCNNIREYSPCDAEAPATWYRVGDDGFDLQCQPACFNLSPTMPTYNATGERVPDIMMLNWHENECRLVDSATVAWLEKPFYRSKTLYEKRLNDMPTGFSRTTSTNPYGSGLAYRPNETYCKYYDRTLKEDLSCDMTLWEKVLDSIIGMALINAVKSTLRTFDHGKPFDLPKDLPQMPDKVPEQYTLEGWRKNINNDFVLPKIIETLPKQNRRHKREAINDYDHYGDLSEFSKIQLGILDRRDYEIGRINKFRREANERLRNFKRANNFHDNVKLLNRKKREIIDLINSNKDTFGLKEPLAADDDDDDQIPDNKDDDETPPSEVQEAKYIQIIRNLLSRIASTEFFEQLGYDIATQAVLSHTKSLCNRIMQKLISDVFQKSATRIIGKIGDRILGASMQAVYTRMVVGSVVRYASQAAIFAAKFVASLASIIGIILIFTTILSLVFTFWDPYGYNNLFPPNVVQDMMANSELAFRQALKSATATFSVEQLMAKLLTEDEILEIQLQSLLDTVLYLDALTVNSEGSRINKGTLIDLRDLNQDNIESGITKSIAQEIVRWDDNSYHNFNERFLTRVDLNRTLNYVAVGLMAMSALILFARLTLLAIVVFILAVLVLATGRLAISNNWLLDGYATLRPRN